MKECKVTHIDELPLVLNAKHVAEIMGISESNAYELMRREDFPSHKPSPRRVVVGREAFLRWLNRDVEEDKSKVAFRIA